MSSERWKDRSVLQELYWDRGLSISGVADELGCSRGTIEYWMDKLDVETRPPTSERPPEFRTNPNSGYEIIRSQYNNQREPFRHHRLLGVMIWGFDEMDGKHIHHKNKIPWDNREENLELLSKGDHSDLHNDERYDGPWRDEETLRELVNRGLTDKEIADELGCSDTTVRNWKEEYNITDVVDQQLDGDEDDAERLAAAIEQRA